MLTRETEKVWTFLKSRQELAGFILIGGSALALSLQHRLSEDLDFVCAGTRLPRGRIDAALREGSARGIGFEPRDDPAAMEEFQSGGMDLRDYQQNYLALGKVRVSFFTGSDGLERVLGPADRAGPRVASVPELFKTKCLVSAQRSKSRDWLDLYLLFRDRGFTLRDYRQAFIEAGSELQFEAGLARLCSGVPQAGDEGYAHLLAHPPQLAEIKDFFVKQRDQFEMEQAAAAKRAAR